MTIYTGAGIEIAMTEARIAPIWIEMVEMTAGYKQANRHLSPPTTEHKVTETAGFFARLQVKGGHILHGGRWFDVAALQADHEEINEAFLPLLSAEDRATFEKWNSDFSLRASDL